MSSVILALDCTGETFAAGLLLEGEFLTTINGLNPRRALRELPAHIRYLLQNAGASYRDVEAVGLTQGPGSFTGVRLGVTLAKTIAQQAGCQVAAFDTLQVLASAQESKYSHRPGTIAVALDARRKELYCGLFGAEASRQPTAVRSPGEFSELLASVSDLRACVGQGFSAYPELVPESFFGPVLSTRQDSAPCMATLCAMTQRAQQNSELTDWQNLLPAYHRKADIQVSGGAK